MPVDAFIDHPIDEIFVSPDETPYGLGIGRCSTLAYDYRAGGEAWRELWAITKCCKARVVLIRNDMGEWPWRCDGCDERLRMPSSVPDPKVSCFVLENERSYLGTPEKWISAWTGIASGDIHVEVEN